MIKMCFSLLLVFLLINFQVKAKNSCNDECLTKTYCLSSDGSGVCSKNNLVTAEFRGIMVFGVYDYLQLTLKSYNVAPDDEKTIKVSIKPASYHASIYTCYKSSIGSTTAMYNREDYTITTGSSYYTEGVLTCSWTFNIDSSIWPFDVDMIVDSSSSITLYQYSQGVMVAQNTSQLPIYHAQYLKCCNKVHGNDDFLITFDQTEKQIRYRLYYWKTGTKLVLVTLTRKDEIKLLFRCYPNDVVGFIINGSKYINIDKQLIEPTEIQSEICSWATPFVLGDSVLSIDASTSVFDLEVKINSDIVYTEKDVTLKNSSHLFKLSFTLIAFAVLFQISLICS